MERNWSRAIAEILASEGGYSNNPKDPGGPTNLGVTLDNFRRFVKPNGTIADLKALTRDQAAVVFRRQYWDQVMGSALPDGVDYCVCDFAVNSGDDRAERLAQTVAGAGVDGAIGPDTLKMIAAIPPSVFITRYCDERLAFLKRIKNKKTGALLWDEFGGGWQTRVDKVRKIALSMTAQPTDAPAIEVKTVEVEKPIEVAVVPKGADKPGIGRWMASVPLLGTAVTAFGGVDNVTKAIVLGVVFLGVVALLLRGEQIAARAKSVVASFET